MPLSLKTIQVASPGSKIIKMWLKKKQGNLAFA